MYVCMSVCMYIDIYTRKRSHADPQQNSREVNIRKDRNQKGNQNGNQKGNQKGSQKTPISTNTRISPKELTRQTHQTNSRNKLAKRIQKAPNENLARQTRQTNSASNLTKRTRKATRAPRGERAHALICAPRGAQTSRLFCCGSA